jgi:hypothetical protein
MLLIGRRQRAMKTSCVLLFSAVLMVSCGVSARDWYVTPGGTGDAATIQAGIDSASAGDTVVLASGIFSGPGNRDVEYSGKAITVRSESGDPATCIIDCEGSAAEPHRGFCFCHNEGRSSVLQGVTITGGFGGAVMGLGGCGGGVLCAPETPGEDGPSPAITDCIFIANEGAAVEGGGIGCLHSGALIENCHFEANIGGAVSLFSGADEVRNCTIVSTPHFAICLQIGEQAAISGCTLYANQGGIASVDMGSHAYVSNTIVTGCTTRKPVESDPLEFGVATLTCCDIYGNAQGDWVGIVADQYGIDGNFSVCPSFCNAAGGDFQLCDDSPCLPGNHPDGYVCGLVGAWGEGCSCGPTGTDPTSWGGVKSMY